MKYRERVKVQKLFYCKLLAAKRSSRLEELSSMLDVDIHLLSKYINKHVVPSTKRMLALIERLGAVDYIGEIRRCLLSGPYRFPETNNIAVGCPELLECVDYELLDFVDDQEVDVVLTIEGGGLLLASNLPRMTKAKLVYAVRDVLVSGGRGILYKNVPAFAWGPRIKRYITLPLRNEIRGKNVLIVDDVSWTGETVLSLLRYAREKKANPIGVFLLGAFDDALKNIVKNAATRVRCLLTFTREDRNRFLGFSAAETPRSVSSSITSASEG